MGRILRKKPTSLKKRKKPEAETGEAGSSAVAGGAAGSSVAGVLPAEAKPRPALLPKKPQAAIGSPAATPPADNVFTRSVQFLREVKIELKKVTWPSRKQTMGSTLVVIVLVSIISVFLGIVDIGLSTVIRAVFK